MSELIELTVEQIKAIDEKGFCYVQTSPMCFERFTINDIRIKKEDLERIERGEI
jgi:hypothetical protein